MAIHIVEIHPAEEPGQLNREWFVVENRGDKPFSTRNCALSVGTRGKRKRAQLGTMEPGFIVAPGERVRVITGHPGRKAHGEAPEDGLRNYSLFLNAPVLRNPGVMLALTLRSLPITTAVYDPEAEGCIEAAQER